MGRPRFCGLIHAALAGSCLLFSGRAAAAPEFRASIVWEGECDDRASLQAEIEARGAHLLEVAPGEGASSLTVSVQQPQANLLLAEVGLVTPDAREQRRVEAHECQGLRRALAWVLSVLAEEQQAAKQSSQVSSSAFPAPAPSSKINSAPSAPQPSPAPPRQIASPPAASAPPTPRDRSCARSGRAFGLGAELLLGFGLIDAVTLGPALYGAYRPCSPHWPSITLGAAHLRSVGYELDTRSVSVVRTTGQVGVLFDVVGQTLRAGVSFELGRIRASGASSEDGAGGSSRAPWAAFVAPVRVSAPLLSSALSVEVGMAAAYTPQSFVLRYASGAVLARPRHVELRGSLGLVGHF
jgi:hypothetical protein